jgi:hypothetical protein
VKVAATTIYCCYHGRHHLYRQVLAAPVYIVVRHLGVALYVLFNLHVCTAQGRHCRCFGFILGTREGVHVPLLNDDDDVTGNGVLQRLQNRGEGKNWDLGNEYLL